MANVARRKKVAFADFIKGYKAGCAAGLSAEEIAESLDMAEPSMTSRASGIRQLAAEHGKSFPSPAGGGVTKEEKLKSKIELLTSLLDDLDVETVETETGETAETETGETAESDESVE